jgi:hypothetical protein
MRAQNEEAKGRTIIFPGSNRQNMKGRWRWVSFVWVAVIFTVASCTKTSIDKSREVADRFIDLYYARVNMAEAVKLCGGDARTKLEDRLRAIKGVAPDQPAGEPRVTFNLTASTNPTPTQATYTYKVTAHTSDVGNVVATLTVTEEGGRWAVTSFNETEGPPRS